MRSCSMISLERFISSALRCAESRLSLCRCFWWRIGSASLAVAQIQTARLQRLDDFLDRLATEVRDRGQLRLRLLQQLADRLNSRALEAVVGANAQLELLDQDVVHRAAAAGARSRADSGEAAGHAATLTGARLQLLEPLGVGEDRERLDEDLRSLAQRGLRVHRAVSFDVERQAIVVRALADAGAGDAVGNALDR